MQEKKQKLIFPSFFFQELFSSTFTDEKVAAEEDGVWTTGKVQCLYKGILSSRTRMLPANSILPNKSQPISIVWADNTDSICDILPALFHSLLSFPAMLPRLHLLVPQDFLRASPLDQMFSSIVLQGQALLFSSSNCSTTSVFLSSVTFA